MNFDVLHAATNNKYADNIEVWLVNLGPITFISKYNLTNKSGKHLEDVNNAHIVVLMYKLITSSRGSGDLSIGFDRNRNRRRELINNKNKKGKYHVRIMLKDIFVFSEHQEKASFGLGYKLTLTGNSDNSVLNKDNAINIGENKNIAIEWYVPHYKQSIPQQALLSKQILSKTPTELQYVGGSVFLKEVNNQNLWTSELGNQE